MSKRKLDWVKRKQRACDLLKKTKDPVGILDLKNLDMGIYGIHINSRLMYVGQARNVGIRIFEHFLDWVDNPNQTLGVTYDEFLDIVTDVEVELIESVSDTNNLDSREKYHINTKKPQFHQSKNASNIEHCRAALLRIAPVYYGL